MLNRTLVQAVLRGTLVAKGFSGILLASAGILALSTNLSLATTTPTSWDVASEFTDASNVTGAVWTYGEEAVLNGSGSFTLFPNQYNTFSGNIAGWTNAGGYPLVAHNVNQTAFLAGNVTFAPHSLQMHPGPNCEYADVRFTAPMAGKYKVSGQFFGLDDNGTQTITDVHVSVNQMAIYNQYVDLTVPSMHFASFTVQSPILLAANDVVDFQVGCGTNGNYNYDSTGLNAVVEWYAKKRK